jgi:ribosomal protein L29
MNAKELKKQSEKELIKLLGEKETALRQFRFDITGSKIKNIKGGATLRKEIARILTELNARKA